MTNYLKLLPVLALLTGCAAASSLPALSGLIPAQTGPQILTTTDVNLSEQNYKIVKADATGSSTGFSFLGLITLRSPRYQEAVTRLYWSANVAEGKAQALVNVMHEHTSNYYLLFALPRITVRADVIEFTDWAERHVQYEERMR